MHSEFIPIYLDYNRMKTIYNLLFEYKNAFWTFLFLVDL